MDEHTRHLEQALKEKEEALRELQHRAKNSLQLVISLLKLQSGRIRDPDARSAYELTLQRIEALAIAYRHLHESGSETQVEFGRYLTELVTTTSANVPGGAQGTDIDVQSEKITGGLSLAVPLGLIVNELLTNSLRHAFPAKSWIRISLTRPTPESIELVISDNGRGLPSGFDPDADAGMLLAEALAAQLNATLMPETTGSGTVVRMTVPL
ncbi:sensor histidine kinase [Skermanella stibiiresistens]|jgi:two-component sensor histidine kinase|uniref:sensor histidine kinase n=1 Tax=Skermanella stibiiresistens TaxID=913326 RepID=UPI0018DE6575|nr:sensor histidine kinase [Skermanella stibiiresistens]